TFTVSQFALSSVGLVG
ncbi:hypothetical protein D046_1531B, partial [Vibrio parahaemolyticus V-223/04]